MATLHARLLPLEGKYYGSRIELTRSDGRDGDEAWIVCWINSVSDYKPSERELEGWDEEEFGPYEISDDHYESQTCLTICNKIVETLEGLEV